VISRRYDDLAVSIHADATALGKAIAEEFTAAVRNGLQEQETVGVVLQTGGSQRPFYEALGEMDLDWSRIELFHLDEYIGIPGDHPLSFRRWIREHVAERFGARTFHELRGDAPDARGEARRYGDLLRERDPQICVLSIGEDGQLAFNEPPAEIHTLDAVLIVELAEGSRRQLVRQGQFGRPEDAPDLALSLSIPALLSRRHVLACVPERRKAAAVRAALEGPITRSVPASSLRTCPRAHVHLDLASASELAEPVSPQP
jgi:glucosamine-6-phosphate deaminase